ncbi:MAG: polysaccharide deacetylase family protein [Burkholderiaceae bacterium]|nr:polysaccharide deacetylase family protein [Burkholderiaceae bacterium]
MLRHALFFLLAGFACISQCNADEAASKPAPIRFLISFDDGPSGDHVNNSTEQVLDVLAYNGVQPGIKALFFVQTEAVRGGGTETGKKLLAREQTEGHLIEFHTSTPHHSDYTDFGDEELDASLNLGVSDLIAVKGVAPTLVRPPFWHYDARTLAAYQKHGMRLLLTDLSANDGKIWGVNFSFHKHSNLLKQLSELRPEWEAGKLPVVDGVTPIVVTFHDVNTYTSNHVEVYLKILLQVAQELDMPVADKSFYEDRAAVERAALARTVKDGEVRPRLPGIWNWLWQ